jgi:CDP-L-myo-inositol myo-inositolphosphotransferase
MAQHDPDWGDPDWSDPGSGVHGEPSAAVVLAAGRGVTVRSPHPKALRRVGGVSLLERGIRALLEAGVDRIVVVAGYRSADVIAAVRELRLPVEVVVNDDWEAGTATSVLAGMRQLGAQRCLVVMGDQVFEPDDVRRLVKSPGRTVLAVDRDLNRQVGGLSGLRPVMVRIGPGGRVQALDPALTDFDAVDGGLSVVQVEDVLRASEGRPPETWLGLRQRMLADGCDIGTSDLGGLWAAIDTPEVIGPLEHLMWHRYGPKPTDSTIVRVFHRRISGPLTRRLLRTGMSPDTATGVAFAVTLAACVLLATGDRWLMLAGGVGVLLGSALDCVDGELARVSGRVSRRGAALDTLLDRYADLAVVLGLVLATGASQAAWAWGFAAAAGSLLVSYIHAIARDTDVRLLFRREFRLLIFSVAAIAGLPLWGLIGVAVAANLDVVRGVVLVLRAMRT